MVLSAVRRFLPKNPGLIQKLKVPKCVYRSTLASVCNEPTLFAIFGPARGQIFGRTAKTYKKIDGFLPFLGQKAPSGAQMLVSGAWGARNQHLQN